LASSEEIDPQKTEELFQESFIDSSIAAEWDDVKTQESVRLEKAKRNISKKKLNKEEKEQLKELRKQRLAETGSSLTVEELASIEYAGMFQ
jgi:hypothetical protein